MLLVGRGLVDMKLTKAELKGIVKECLMEIFSESFNLVESRSTRQPTRNTGALNERKQLRERTQPQINPIKTGDPILDSIIADTARTTLPAMLEAEGKRSVPANPGVAERIVAQSEPESLFGEETASKWAALAFNDFSGKT